MPTMCVMEWVETEYLWVLDCWFNKTTHLKTLSWTMGKCGEQFSRFCNILLTIDKKKLFIK